MLASASPRRQELLRNAGIEFIVQAANIPEISRPNETPGWFAERMAREKALAVRQQRPNDLILAADTIVVIDGQILGKPSDPQDAARMLRVLSGRKHEVITGVCVTAHEKPAATRSEVTSVLMNALSDEDIRSYIATGEPMDKAGAYAIQGMASRWIPRIEGDYFNVVGLPMALTWQMLKEAGWET